jgi:hypothetical protein
MIELTFPFRQFFDFRFSISPAYPISAPSAEIALQRLRRRPAGLVQPPVRLTFDPYWLLWSQFQSGKLFRGPVVT